MFLPSSFEGGLEDSHVQHWGGRFHTPFCNYLGGPDVVIILAVRITVPNLFGGVKKTSNHSKELPDNLR